MYPPHHQGGYEVIWRSAVEHLRARGHTARVLTTDHRETTPDASLPESDDVHRELRWYWKDYEFPRLRLRELLDLERHNAAVFDRHLRELRPDVVAWWSMGGMSLSLLERARRAGLPALGVVIDDWPLYGPKVDQWTHTARRFPPLGWWARLPVPRRLGRTAEWSFTSRLQRERVRRRLGNPPERIDYPGVDRSHFRAAPPHAEWRGRLLYCGRLDRRKGVDMAVEALASLPGMTLRIVGVGEHAYVSELRDLAASLGVAERVELAGRVPRQELPAAYAAADAVVFPVRWDEPFGLVPLEAMAVGRPVVATGRGGSGEYLVRGENALVFERDAGAPALAESVRTLAADAELRAKLHAGGLATAERLSEQAYNEAIERRLLALAAQPNVPTSGA